MKIKYLIILILLLTAVFGFSGSVKALTIQELQAQIQSLIQQIAQLQEQLKQQQGQEAGNKWCYNFTKNLRIGDKDKDIENLIVVLQKEGIISQNDYSLKDFNENLASYISEFQEKYASEILKPNGLRKGNGYVGPATRRKLNALYGCTTTSLTPVIPPIACAMDAKQCPDGSFVGRVAPSCEFAKCPEIKVDCQNLWWHDNTTKICSQKQFCGAFMYYGLKTFNSKLECDVSIASEGSFSNADYTCQDGSVFNEGGPTSCKPSATWQDYANQTCQNKCSVTTGKCGVSSFSVSNQCSSLTQSPMSDIIYFYWDTCPFCKVVDKYILENNIEQKVKFTKLETSKNSTNKQIQSQRAVACGLQENNLGVPFVWDGKNCHTGQNNVINFFSKYLLQ